MKFIRAIITVLFLASLAFLATARPTPARPALTHSSGQQSTSSHRLAASFQSKLDHLQQNAQVTPPDQTPTVMTEDEVNDYIAAGKITLPQGVQKLSFQGRTGVITALLKVDFDQIRAGQHSANPLLSIFNGVHDVTVEADASGAGGQGKVHVRGVTIDGIEVPQMALEYFVSKYITPKYPNVGIDSQFKLPERTDSATVGYHKLTVVQK